MTPGVKKNENTGAHERPPIAVVMGHIDHGKTTLLDFIRKTKVAEKESGGITQHIGAYEAEHQGKRITFIDTPGHEAFSAMRARGADIADIAILVVSAEDGVKPQTKEAIAIIQEAEIPFAVAINKIDKPNADPQRTKKDLADAGVLVEEYGGKIPAVAISAKTGENVDTLLDTVLLLAELEECRWDPTHPAEGVVIESHTDPKRGRAATLLLRDGVLRQGETLVIGKELAPLRVMENFRGEQIREAKASMPVLVYNLSEAAAVGASFRVFEKKGDAEVFIATLGSSPKKEVEENSGEEGRSTLNIILKTDVAGSREAIEKILSRLQFAKAGNRIIRSETGDINESDIKMAIGIAKTVIVGFRVKLPASLKELAEVQSVSIIIRDVIYDLEEDVRKTMLELVPGETRRVDLAKAKILAVFNKEKNKQIVGGKVLEGILKRGARFEIERNKVKIGIGKIFGLQQQKKEAGEVREGFEFGMLAEASIGIAEGDTVYVFEEEKLAPVLE